MRALFSFTGRVTRRDYVVVGTLLMAVKVAVDVGICRAALGRWTFPPFAFDLSALFTRQVMSSGPGWAPLTILLWSLPFVWIGTAMSSRRATDAALSPAWAALFVVPFLNWVLILVLSALPTRERVRALDDPPDLPGPRPVHGVVAAALATIVTVALTALVVYGLKDYGAALFVGTPMLFGAVCAYAANIGRRRTLRNTLGIVWTSLACLGVVLLLAAMEGAVCILMAAPIAFILATMGAMLGFGVADACAGPRAVGPVAVVLPALLALDALAPPPEEHEVASCVEIDAPPETVWRHVVGFSTIPDAPEGLFRAGLACPVRATIDGRGVGAVRHCDFTTGAFVEPITVWDEPRRLAFDVASQPPPLVEWSPYAHVHAPHLDGYFRSVRGEFRLVALEGGRTRLEGSTWYLLDIGPRAYWDLWADDLVHRIHLRVLRHVKRLAESDG
jgi:uncharacterized membrane protein YhaH (DUF805 family)